MTHKIDVARLKTKAIAEPELELGEPYLSRAEQGFNIYWCDENPALFGQSVQRFLLEYPPDKWNITIRPAIMPGETWTMIATRKDQ